MAWQVHHKCAEELLAELPDNSVDLILTDPPYFKVKRAAWDNQWKTEADFLAWLGTILEQYKRVLKPNGSLYVFASPQMAAEVEVLTKRHFHVLNSIVWRKPGANCNRRHEAQVLEKGFARGWFPETERIIFAEHHGAEEGGYFVFESVRAYLDGERAAAGLTRAQIDAHFRTANVSQYWWQERCFILPTADKYAGLQALAPGHFTRPYDRLREEYEELRRPFELARRPFDADASAPYTDVWEFPTAPTYPGKHECEKDQSILQRIIKASSRPGAVVLDTFMGGGSTGQACLTLGRNFIGCDMDEHWHGYSTNRLRTVEQQLAQGGPVVWPVGRQTKPKTKSRPNSSVEQAAFSFDSVMQ